MEGRAGLRCFRDRWVDRSGRWRDGRGVVRRGAYLPSSCSEARIPATAPEKDRWNEATWVARIHVM